jgi:hypothetical protein
MISSPEEGRRRSALGKWFRSGTTILVFAFLIRLVTCWQVLHSIPLPHFWRGAEQGAIASSILRQHVFASPYDQGQLTAWIAPIYPCVVAPVFGALGAYSLASTNVLVGLNVLFSALTSLVIYAIGKRMFGVNGGATAGWLWTFCLPDAVMPLLIWDTCLSALLLSTGFLVSLPLQTSKSYRQWGWVGLFWGVTCLVNPALISPVPFLWALFWFGEWRRGRNLWRQATLSAVLFLAVLSPWLVRNYRVFHTPIFVRSNFGAELYFGNLGFESHPLGSTMEYQNLGELPYVAQKQHAVLEYIRNNFWEFSANSLHRAGSFWIVPQISQMYWLSISLLSFTGLGLAIWERKREAPPFLVVMVFYPLVYYVTYVFPKYRHPIEPLMFVLAAYPLVLLARFSRLRIWGGRPNTARTTSNTEIVSGPQSGGSGSPH